MVVRKRDGSEVQFDPEKIKNAICLAMSKTAGGYSTELAEKISKKIESRLVNKNTEVVDVESIQDMVERLLMDSHRKDVAKEYTLHREKRNIARQSKTRLMFEEIVNIKSNDVTRENANMNSDTPAGMMMKFASESTKPFVDNYLLDTEVKEACRNNIIHIHDKDYYPTKSLTCLQHPLDIIFKRGFRAGHGELRAPKRIETAATQACVSMETVQNEMHGGQAIPAFDFYLAPFVRMIYVEEVNKIAKLMVDQENEEYWEAIRNAEIKDYIVEDLPCNYVDNISEKRIIQAAINQTVERVHQAMESFVHNMNNIHSRGGNQVVFSSINYGTDTSAEGRCVTRELLKTTERGVGNGATAIFPIQIWKLKDGVSHLPSDPNYDLYKYACKVSARRFFPNFLNLDSTFNKSSEWKEDDPKRYEHEVATMGCRTRIWSDRFGKSTSIGRGNLSFTTINLPRLALEAAIKAGIYENVGGQWKRKENVPTNMQDKAIDIFFETYLSAIRVCAKQLDDRYKFQATAKARQFPLLMSGLWVGSEELGPDDTIEPVIKHGTLGIGFIGLAEALVALTGKHHGECEDSQRLGLKIVGTLNEECKKYSDMYDHNYSAFATPAEGLSGKFTKVDAREFGVVKGVIDKDYYTNSNHVPVEYKCTAKHKAEIEGPYHKITPAGHIFYVEVDGDLMKNSDAILDIVDTAVVNDIGYISINHNQIRCEHCNHEDVTDKNFKVDEEGNYICPKCGSKDVTFLARITGYLTTDVRKWNSGKLAEFKDRVVHES